MNVSDQISHVRAIKIVFNFLTIVSFFLQVIVVMFAPTQTLTLIRCKDSSDITDNVDTVIPRHPTQMYSSSSEKHHYITL